MIHRREIKSLCVLSFAAFGSLAPWSVSAQGQTGRAQVQPPAQVQPQQQVPRPAQPQQPVQGQPEGQPQEPAVTPAVEQLLNLWEQRSSQVSQLYGEFERYSYDSIYGTEKRCRGRLWFEAPDSGRIDFMPFPIDPNANNINPDKLTDDGRPYQIVEDFQARWICNGRHVFAINDSDHTYAEMSIPPQFQGENIIDSPLPFLFGMQAERAKQRYFITIGAMHNPDGRIEGAPLNVHVIVQPRWEQDAREWTSAEILLNPETFLPNAVRIISPGGSGEEVYVFSRTEPALRNVSLWNGDPFNDTPPSNYTCIERQTAGAPEQNPLQRSAGAPPQGVIPQ